MDGDRRNESTYQRRETRATSSSTRSMRSSFIIARATAPLVDGFFAFLTPLKKSLFVQFPEFGSGGGFRWTEVAEGVKLSRHRFLLQGLMKLVDEIGVEARVGDEDSSP